MDLCHDRVLLLPHRTHRSSHGGPRHAVTGAGLEDNFRRVPSTDHVCFRIRVDSRAIDPGTGTLKSPSLFVAVMPGPGDK